MHSFVTVDAETEVIRDGIRAISRLRDQAEAATGLRIPIVWFVRFQRTWQEYVENESPDYFAGPYRNGFDGFALAKTDLLALRSRGDEIGWHYHAYNYVHRDDLSHATRVTILEHDLGVCSSELRRRHPELPVQSFRFGWFFVPDYAIYETLGELGITRDASEKPRPPGARVAAFRTKYLERVATEPTELKGVVLFPHERTVLVHDWEVVRHDFDWSSQGRLGARRRRRELAHQLPSTAARLGSGGGTFMTYEMYARLASSAV